MLGRQCRFELSSNPVIAKTMIRILKSMEPAERIEVGNSADEKGTLVSKVEWLLKEGRAYALDEDVGMGHLSDVIKLMSGTS